MATKPFDKQLEEWLNSDRPKTLQDLIDNFAQKGFAVFFLVLMSIPALPLPTGGLTHVFEIISMLLALELIVGVRQVWLPKKWRRLNLSRRVQKSTLPFLIKVVRRVGKLSKPRLNIVLENIIAVRVIGLLVFTFSLIAFLAPPFSGLDTLPSLGVVLIALAIIFEDFVLFLTGLAVGLIGTALIYSIGKALINVL